MNLSPRNEIKQTNKLALTQELLQSIEMLQLSNIELAEKIAYELVDNPVLEEEIDQSPQSSSEKDAEMVSSIDNELSGGAEGGLAKEEWENVNAPASDSYDEDRKRNFIENAVAQQETLEEHLISQASLVAEDETELSLFIDIITSLNDKGFLTRKPEEIAEETRQDLDEVRNAVRIINSLDPPGCGTGSIRESLIVQAKLLYPEDDILSDILNYHFLDIEKLQYKKIAESLAIAPSEVIKKSRLVRNLNPFPGLKYSLQKTRYITPDIEVKLVGNEIITAFNDDWIPKIKINPYYDSLFRKKAIDAKLSEYLKEKIQSAKYLIRNISSRRETIIKVVSAIMEYQKNFLKHGPGSLKPLVYSDIAMEIGMHESTIGRTANNKYVQTSWGTFEIKYFFVSKIKSKNHEDHSSDEVLNQIKKMISSEDPQKPLSDLDIVEILNKKGINIARRTIAKYRSSLNIPSSGIRKRINL